MTYHTMTASVRRSMTDHSQRRDDAVIKAADVQRRATSAGMDTGMRVLSYLISGIVVYGALGWVGDHFLGTSFLLPIGILLGAGLAIFVSIRLVQHQENLSKPVSTPSKPLRELSAARWSAEAEGEQ